MNEDLKRAKYSLSSLESLIDQLNTTLYTSELSNGETSSTSNSVIEEELRYRTAPAANGAPMSPSLFTPQRRSVVSLTSTLSGDPVVELKAPVIPRSILHSSTPTGEVDDELPSPPQRQPKQPITYHLCKSLVSTSTQTGIHCLAIVGPTIWAGGLDGTIGIWHRDTGKLLGSRQAHKARIFAMIRTKDGNIWTASDDNRIRIWTRHAAFFDEISLAFHLSAMVLCEDEMWCASYDEQLIKVIDVYVCRRNGMEERTRDIKIAFKTPMPIRYMFCDDDVVWICSDEDILRLNRNTQQVIDAVAGVRTNTLIRVGHTVWGGSSDSTITVYDRDTGACLRKLQGHEKNVYTLLCVGDSVWSGGWDKIINIWDTRDYSLLGSLRGHKQPLSHMVSVPLTRHIYSTVPDSEASRATPSLSLPGSDPTPASASLPTSPTRPTDTTSTKVNTPTKPMSTKSTNNIPTRSTNITTPTKSTTGTQSGVTTSPPVPRSSILTKLANVPGKLTGSTTPTRSPSILTTSTKATLTTTPVPIPAAASEPNLTRARIQRSTTEKTQRDVDREENLRPRRFFGGGGPVLVGSFFSSSPQVTRRKTTERIERQEEDRTARTPKQARADVNVPLVPYSCTVETIWTSSWDGTVLVWL